MNQRSNKILTLVVCSTLLILSACTKESNDNADSFTTTDGVLVINEGGFLNNNGSITSIDPLGNTTQNLFSVVNGGATLGDIVQSYTEVGDFGLIAVNNSQKVEVVSAENFTSVTTLTANLDYPRYGLAINDTKAYITNGSGAGTLVVIDLNDQSVKSTISVGDGPEEIIQSGDFVYVANSGGFDLDSTVSVVNPNSDQEVQKIQVGVRPTALEKDANGNIWVLCEGGGNFASTAPFAFTRTSAARLINIDVNSRAIINDIELIPVSDNEGTVSRLAISLDRSTLYYLKNNAVHSMDITATEAPTDAFIPGSFYGVDVHPATGDIWATTFGFATAQQVKIHNTNGSEQSTFDVGIGPNGVYFNN